jgi:hypothetical protein
MTLHQPKNVIMYILPDVIVVIADHPMFCVFPHMTVSFSTRWLQNAVTFSEGK